MAHGSDDPVCGEPHATSAPVGLEVSVRNRYAAAAQQVEPALCCPVQYDARYLAVIPQEVIERDYGCGNPTPYVRTGETVLDLGSGGGKVCYIAAQLVGARGRVIGVDSNLDMLALARRHQRTVSEQLGYANVEFRCGMIQDLRLDLDLLAGELARHPLRDQQGWLELRAIEDRLRAEHPLIADATVDCVLSNCVLNLTRPQDRPQLFHEIFRVLRPGGRAAISDIVADRDVPERLRRDPELWSGCIAGAYREDRFLEAFAAAGFHGIHIARRDAEPWRVLDGIQFLAVTVLAYKGGTAAAGEGERHVLYRGPLRSVQDDQGHVFQRGVATVVAESTWRRLQTEPYAGMFEAVGDAVAQGPERAVDTAQPKSCCGPQQHC